MGIGLFQRSSPKVMQCVAIESGFASALYRATARKRLGEHRLRSLKVVGRFWTVWPADFIASSSEHAAPGLCRVAVVGVHLVKHLELGLAYYRQ